MKKTFRAKVEKMLYRSNIKSVPGLLVIMKLKFNKTELNFIEVLFYIFKYNIKDFSG
jgi:hypothetical protein